MAKVEEGPTNINTRRLTPLPPIPHQKNGVDPADLELAKNAPLFVRREQVLDASNQGKSFARNESDEDDQGEPTSTP